MRSVNVFAFFAFFAAHNFSNFSNISARSLACSFSSARSAEMSSTLSLIVCLALCVCIAAPLRDLPLRSMHSLIPWQLGKPRNAPDRWDREHERQLQEQEREAARGNPKRAAKAVTMHASWAARVTHSVANAAGAFVPTAAKSGPFAQTDDDEDGVNAARDEKARALQEEQTTTSTVEQHYYHMHEVWHCLYNRTETNHLRDPDNTKFKSEDARKRQISLFESLMQTSQVELYQAVNADIDNECCARLQVRTHLS